MNDRKGTPTRHNPDSFRNFIEKNSCKTWETRIPLRRINGN